MYYCKRRRRRQNPIATVTSVVIKTGPHPTLEVLNSNGHEIIMSTLKLKHIQHPSGLLDQLIIRPRTLPWLLELNAFGIIP